MALRDIFHLEPGAKLETPSGTAGPAFLIYSYAPGPRLTWAYFCL